MKVDVKITKNFDKVKKVVDDGVFKTFNKAAFAIGGEARKSIRPRGNGDPAPPGQPPLTRRGQLRRSIKYFVDKEKQFAIIGATESIMGREGASIHEHGGLRRGQRYRSRPFMRPALDRVAPRMPRMWAAS